MTIGLDPQSKLVVLWDGPHWSSEHTLESQQALIKKLEFFIRQCGADPQRCLEGPFSSAEFFIQRHRHILSQDSIKSGQVVVIFTRTAVLTDILQVRRQLEVRLPVLEDALWVIYDDLKRTSLFTYEMERHGELDDNINNAPIWTSGFTNRSFLILTPDYDDLEHLHGKLQKLRSEAGTPMVVPSSKLSVKDLPAVRPADLPSLRTGLRLNKPR